MASAPLWEDPKRLLHYITQDTVAQTWSVTVRYRDGKEVPFTASTIKAATKLAEDYATKEGYTL